MTNHDAENGATRAELVQRVALMETMIAEGRQSTARFGWIFVLWGLINLGGMGWSYLQPRSYWVWPVTIASGFAIQFIGLAMRRGSSRSSSSNTQNRSVAAVWRMMGIGILLYVTPAIVRHDTAQVSYIAAIFMFLGLAHATSATILSWRAQGVVAATWWIGGMAMYFVRTEYVLLIYVAEMFFGMVVFGLYAMWLEQRRATALVQHHA